MPMTMKFHSPPKPAGRSPKPFISPNDEDNANNLLEMRSQAIQAILREKDRVGHWGTVAVETKPNATAEALHKHLGVDKAVLVSSPLQIDTTAPGVVRTGGEKGKVEAGALFARKYINSAFPHIERGGNTQLYPHGQVTNPVGQDGRVGQGLAYGRQLRGGWPANDA